MSVYNVYCLGTGHSSNQSERLLPDIFRTYDRSPADRKQLMEGLGTSAFGQTVAAANNGEMPRALGARGKAVGKGWGNVVMQVMAGLQAAHQAQPMNEINLVGHSRGAVTCHMIAHAIEHAMPGVMCNITAIDPVPGGAFDFSPWWELNAADRGRLGLDGKSPETLPANVSNYFAIYMEKDTNPCFGILGPSKLIHHGNTAFTFLPMYGKHGCCVKSDIDNVPASRIALSIILERLTATGVAVDRTRILTPVGYAEAYAQIYLNAIAEGENPKSVANYSKKMVACLVAASVLTAGLGGLVLAAGNCSSYWRNRRASDIPNDFRANPYYLNFHHRDMFLAGPAGRSVADRTDRYGFMSRTEFEQFSNACPRSYELLVATGLARSLQDPATMTPDDRIIFSLCGEANIKRLEIRPSSADMRSIANLLATQLAIAATEPANASISMASGAIFTPEAWTKATAVRFGARGDQVAVIDQLLPMFHRYSRDRNAAAAFRIACWIGEQAEAHLRTKPGSNRRKGMVQLAIQLISFLQA
jgi:hypothetical protein